MTLVTSCHAKLSLMSSMYEYGNVGVQYFGILLVLRVLVAHYHFLTLLYSTPALFSLNLRHGSLYPAFTRLFMVLFVSRIAAFTLSLIVHVDTVDCPPPHLPNEPVKLGLYSILYIYRPHGATICICCLSHPGPWQIIHTLHFSRDFIMNRQ